MHENARWLQVLVLRLQTQGSVEERVLESSAHKKGLADRSITGKMDMLSEYLVSELISRNVSYL